VQRASPSIVLLELDLPDMPGTEAARSIRRHSDVPIVVLSAPGAPDHRARIIEQYADDYVAKPFDYRELVARIGRILRRAAALAPDRPIVLGPNLRLDLVRRRAQVGGREVILGRVEVRILAALLRDPGQPLTTAELLGLCWPDAESADPSSVWVAMRRLRKKLEVDPTRPRHLLTERGRGYRLASA
jgi:two-component system KDP operon response regulator KdpE